MFPFPRLEQDKQILSACHNGFYNLGGLVCTCNFLQELRGIDCLLCFLCNIFQLKQRMRSVGFPCINKMLNIKLGALIRTLSWLHSSLIPRPFHFHPPFQVNPVSMATGWLQVAPHVGCHLLWEILINEPASSPCSCFSQPANSLVRPDSAPTLLPLATLSR